MPQSGTVAAAEPKEWESRLLLAVLEGQEQAFPSPVTLGLPLTPLQTRTFPVEECGPHAAHWNAAFPSKTAPRACAPARKSFLNWSFRHLACKTSFSSSRCKIKIVTYFFKL